MATTTPNTGELIGGVIDDARELASAEIDKLKAEAKQVGETAKIAGAGLGLLIVALVLLGMGGAFGLSTVVPVWAAFLIVGFAIGVVGVLVLKNGRAIANAF